MLTAKLGFQPLLPSRCYRSFHHAVHRTTRSVRSLAIGVGDYFYCNKVLKWSFIYLIKIRLKCYQTQQCNIQDSETPHNDSPGLRIYRGNVGTPHWRWSRSTLQGYSGKQATILFFCWFFFLFKKTTAVALSATFTTFGIIYQLTMPRHTILHCCC